MENARKTSGLTVEHVRLANEINAGTINAQQQEITRLRSLSYLRKQQVFAEMDLLLAAASWLQFDEDELCFGPDLLHTLLENGGDFALYLKFTAASEPIGMLRYRCAACKEVTCGYAGVRCANAVDPDEVLARRTPKQFTAAVAKVREIRKALAEMGGE